MALSEVVTTFNLHDYFGDNFDPRRAKGWATNNADDQKIDDTSTGETRLGGGTAVIAADGTGTFTHWAPGPDANPASWQTTYHFDIPDRTQPTGRRTKSFGPYTVTASGFLTALEEEQAIPATYLTTVTSQLQAIRDEAQAALDGAVAIAGPVDATVEGLVKNTGGIGPLTSAALANTIAMGAAPLVSTRPAARVVVIGCSIENLYSFRSTTSTSVTEQYGGGDWPTYATLLSEGRFQLVRNMGTGGETTTQYLARFNADVNPSIGLASNQRANAVFIGGAENDIQQVGYDPEVTKANIVEMVRRTRVLGATPLLRTTMPHFLSNAIRQKIGAHNQWIRNYAAEQGIVCFDFWRLTVNPTTGQYRANMSSDGVHPNELAARAMGQHAADVLAEAIPTTPVSAFASDATDTGLLAPTPLFTTDTSGTPTTWNAIAGSPTGVTRSMVTDPLVPGRMARIAHVASSTSNVGIANNSTIIDGDVAGAGDILEVTGVVTSDGGVRATINATINYNDGVAKNIGRAVYFDKSVTRGSYRFRLPAIPAGFTTVIISCLTGSGTGVVDFSYPTVRNLTREGVI